MEQVTQDTIFQSHSYGTLRLAEVVDKIKEFTSDTESSYTIDIGTDSQNHDKTKMIVVICVHKQGSGGIFFYKAYYLDKIKSLKQKIYTETEISIMVAQVFTELMINADLLYDINIHLDIGKYGKTKELIKEITGWVTACGFDNVLIKPESWAASCVANKITK